MIFSIHVTGLGGQGVVTLTKVLAEYSQSEGYKTTLFNSKGMAQRGGRVTSDIRISDNNEREFDSRISAGGADIMIGMEIGEALNSNDRIRPEGTVLLYSRRSVPTTVVMDKHGQYPEVDEVYDYFSQKTAHTEAVPEVASGANIYMLGVLCGYLPSIGAEFQVKIDRLEEILQSSLKRNTEENIDTLKKGYEYGRKITESA